MKHFGTLYKRYLAEIVISPAYIIMTVLYLLAATVALNFQTIVGFFSGDDAPHQTYGLVDATEGQLPSQLVGMPIGEGDDVIYFKPLTEIQEGLPQNFLASVEAGRKPEPSADDLTAIHDVFDRETIKGLVRVSDGEEGNLEVKVYRTDHMSLSDEMTLQGIFDSLNRQVLIAESGLPPDVIQQVLVAQADVERFAIEVNVGDERSIDEKMAGMGVAYAIVLFIFFMNIMYTNTLGAAIATEKSSRVMEVIVTSVEPHAHMLARLLAVMTSAFIQIGLVLAASWVMLQSSEMKDKIVDGIRNVRPAFLIYSLIILFVTIFTYLLLSALFGSLVNRAEEASQAVAPIALLTVAGFYIAMSGMFNAESQLLRISSYIPLLSGFTMPMRLGATSTPMSQAWLSLGIQLIFTALLYPLTATIYRGAVITYRTGGMWQKLKSAWAMRE